MPIPYIECMKRFKHINWRNYISIAIKGFPVVFLLLYRIVHSASVGLILASHWEQLNYGWERFLTKGQ